MFVLVAIYYWRVVLKQQFPFPGDLLVGAYLPWLEHKWGYPTGVPVKNPLISDVFSQFYIWKSLIAESWRNGQVPFWNPYSYSGYPLMANFHSGVFYPLNIFYVFGDVWGWTLLVMSAAFGGLMTMYLYLRQIKMNRLGSVLGAIVYAFSGFAISWAQFITAAHAMIWIPLLPLLLERYFETKRKYYLFWIPVVFFLLVTSGHFQILVYTSIFFVCYLLWKWWEKKELSSILSLVPIGVLTIGIALFQLLPTIELTKFGLRFSENIISAHNYGLLPIKNILTIFAPDFFGNPATGNFFGFFNYHETIIYGSMAAFVVLVMTFFYRSNKYRVFYLVVAMVSIALAFDTIVGRSLYTLKVPGLSTSDAGRIASYLALSVGVLFASFITNIDKVSSKKIFLSFGICIVCLLSAIYLAKSSSSTFVTGVGSLSVPQRQAVAVRNLILPTILMISSFLLIIGYKKYKGIGVLLVVLVVFDLFRFGWKYIPFVPEKIIYPETEITSWLEEKGKTEVFRIERERGELMPPATWMQYRLMSASGYDPMARADYVQTYQKVINGNNSGLISRYSEPERYNASALGLFNVKYLLAIKRDKVGRIPGDQINYTIDQKEWKKVYETGSTVILENTKYQPRVRFISGLGEARISSYTPNKVIVQFTKGSGGKLMLADSWYPGWTATVNGRKTVIEECQEIFRCVNISNDTGEVVFQYLPSNFYIGTIVSTISAVITFLGLVVYSRKKA